MKGSQPRLRLGGREAPSDAQVRNSLRNLGVEASIVLKNDVNIYIYIYISYAIYHMYIYMYVCTYRNIPIETKRERERERENYVTM